MLHNALVALATAFSDDPRVRDFKSRKYFADEAKRRWEEECRTPNISVVQALQYYPASIQPTVTKLSAICTSVSNSISDRTLLIQGYQVSALVSVKHVRTGYPHRQKFTHCDRRSGSQL